MPAADTFSRLVESLDAPARNAVAVTPHDTDELAAVTRALYVGGAGNLTVLMEGGQTVLISGVPAGTLLPIRVKRVNQAGTSASLIVALW